MLYLLLIYYYYFYFFYHPLHFWGRLSKAFANRERCYIIYKQAPDIVVKSIKHERIIFFANAKNYGNGSVIFFRDFLGNVRQTILKITKENIWCREQRQSRKEHSKVFQATLQYLFIRRIRVNVFSDTFKECFRQFKKMKMFFFYQYILFNKS